MMNLQIMQGRLTADPEYKTVGPDQTPVVHFSVACDRDYSKGKEKEPDFFDIVAWRQTAEFIANYFTKGRMILFYGRTQNRSWVDKTSGEKRRKNEIVAEHAYFGDSKKDADPTSAASGGAAPSGPSGPGSGAAWPGPGAAWPGPKFGGGADESDISDLESGDGELPF